MDAKSRTILICVLSALAAVAVVIVIVTVMYRRRVRNKASRRKKMQIGSLNGGDSFAVPLDLLPVHFDFNAPGVVHKGDHVLVPDLALIRLPQNSTSVIPIPNVPQGSAFGQSTSGAFPNSQSQNSSTGAPGELYAVPIEVLPSHFDFNAPGVVHKGDHILVSNLSLIRQPPKGDEYNTQASYNPYF